jgi:HSP20 family molecular chaperone IbpA
MPDLNVQKVAAADDRTLPIFAEFDRLAEQIRLEAYNLFKNRGSDGRALDDWLAAERQFCWPSAELTERGSDYVLKVALAGFATPEITVTATPREVLIKARHEHRASSDKGETRVQWSEFRSNDVFRRIALPGDADATQTTATFKNGLLEIVAPKARAASAPASKKIEIAAA